MAKRMTLFAIASALLVPAGMLVVMLLNPNSQSFGQSLAIVFERVTAQPASILAFFIWTLIFAGLGGLLGFLTHGSERRRRLRHKLCLGCGYDLRGTSAAGQTKCPECGRQVNSV